MSATAAGKNPLLRALLLTFLLIGTSFGAYNTGQFLTGTNQDNNYSSVAVGPGNIFYGAWKATVGPPTYAGFIKFATYNGTTWTEIPASFTGADVAAQLPGLDLIADWGPESIAVDTSGNIHAVFATGASAGGTNSLRGLAYGKYSPTSETWAFRRLYILQQGSGGRNVGNGQYSLKLDSSQNPHVVFEWGDALGSPAHARLQYAFFNGTDWNVSGDTNALDGVLVAISDAGNQEGVGYPDITFDSSNRLHCAYLKERSDQISPDIWYSSKPAGSTTFSTPVIAANVGDASAPSIVVDSGNVVSIADATESGATATFRVSTNASGSFVTSAVANYTPAGAVEAYASYPIMKISATGRRVIVSTVQSYSTTAAFAPQARLIYETIPGTWVQEAALTDSTDKSFGRPSMALRNDNTIMTLFAREDTDQDPDIRNLYYATGVPTNFGTPPNPNLSINNVSLSEGNSGTTTFTFTVSLSAPAPAGGVTFDLATADGTAQDDTPATEDNDYVPQSLTGQTIPAGSSTYSFSVTVNGDTAAETNETFFVNVTNATNATVTDGQGQGTITNDDTSVALTLPVASRAEDGSSNFAFTFTRSGSTAGTTIANFSYTGTAALGTDYTQGGATTFVGGNGTVSFSAGETVKTVSINPTPDNLVESDETLALVLGSGTGYNSVGTATQTATITNDDVNVSLAVSPSSVNENSGTGLVYTFTRSGGPITSTLGLHATLSGTAGVTGDYDPAGLITLNAGTGGVLLSFAAGSATKTVTVTPTADAVIEPDETVILTLTGNSATPAPSGGYTVGAPASATGTILNDDIVVSITSVSASTVGEGSGLGIDFTFSRTGSTTAALTANFTTVGSLAASTDYLLTGVTSFPGPTGTVTFAAGSSTATVTLTPVDDTVVEGDDAVALTVAAGPGYAPAGSPGSVTIIDNDTATVSISKISDGHETGPANAIFSVTQTAVSSTSTVVNYSVGGTATAGAGNDYSAPSGTVTIPAGSTTANINIVVADDAGAEGTETVALTLTTFGSHDADITFGGPQTASADIIDNDLAVSIAADTVSSAEGTGSGSSPYGFTVSRVGGTEGPVTVSYAVTGTGANPANGADFAGGTLPAGVVTIPDGQTSTGITLNVAWDNLVEAAEGFAVTLSNPDHGYGVDTANATAAITNDDTATVSIAKLRDGAEYPLVHGAFRMSISAPSATSTGVTLTVGGPGAGSTPPVGLASIAAGDTHVDIPITVFTDYIVSGTRSVQIGLTGINNGLPGITIGTPSTASLEIADNGPAAIVINAGGSQSAAAGTAFATPLSVRVNDVAGNALSNAAVTFTAPGTNPTGSFLSNVPVMTNGSGIATASTFTAGTTTGSYTVTAAVAGVTTPVSFSLTNTPAAAHHFTVSLPAAASAGTAVTATVTARDQYGNTVTNYTGTVHLTSSDAAATLAADATLTNGVGTFSVTFVTGGDQTVTARDTVTSSVTGTSNGTAVATLADLAVTVTDSPDPVQANGNITYTLTVTNNGPSFSENVTFSLELPPGVTFVSATRTVVGGWGDGFITEIIRPVVGSTGTFTVKTARIESYERFDIVGKVGYLGNGTVLSATAIATAATPDPVPANNSATATTTVSASPEISLFDGNSELAAPILDGQVTAIDFGTTTVNTPVTRSFTVKNEGNDTLSVSGIGVTSGFSLLAPFTPQQPAPGESFTFQILYGADQIGTINGEITLISNDPNESPFNIPITATRTNVAPVAVAQNLTIEEDAVTPVTLAATDADEQPLTFVIVDQPQHGAISGTPPNVIYTPAADYNGTDVFTFKTNDGMADSATVEVNVTINPVNDAPRIVGAGIPDQVQIRPDLPRTIDLTAYFSDPETVSTGLAFSVEVGPSTSNGPVFPSVQAQVAGSSLLISGSQPDVVAITVTATDPGGLFVRDTFTLTTKRVPELAGGGVPPTLVSPSAPTFDMDLAAYFIDGDGDALGYQLINNTNPAVLTAVIPAGSSILSITPVMPGVADLTVRVTDSDGNPIDHTFQVTIDDPIPDIDPTPSRPPVLNRQTGMWEVSVTAVNNNLFNVPGFRFRVTSALPTGMRLRNSTAPIGSPEAYLDVLTTLAPGQSLVVVLEFHSPTRNYEGFNPTIIAEPLPEGISNEGTGEGIDVTRFLNLPDGSKLVEFSSVAGRWYQVEYSSDLATWKRSLVPIQAGANYTQWIDRGPPYTDSPPPPLGQRFYRVSEILPD